MKKFSVIPLLLYMLCSLNVNATETGLFWGSKTPWQKMLTVLYAHGVDTTGMGVTTLIQSDVLNEAALDLAKTFGVKNNLVEAYTENEMVGNVVCQYMQLKYTKNNEKHAYHRICYSTDEYDYDIFIISYPNSRYIDEMKWKKNCMKAYKYWRRSTSVAGCSQAKFYSENVDPCKYEGFRSVEADLRAYSETYKDWELLTSHREKDGYEDCIDFVRFKASHNNYLSGFEYFIDDSISNCEHNNAWKATKEANTIAAYRDYLSSYPHREHADEVRKKISDYEDWMDARESGNYAAYAAYCENHPRGDSVGVAEVLMHRIEESDWQRVKDSKNWLDLQAMFDRYPSGYYSDSAMTAIKALFATPETNMNDVFYSIGNCSVTDTGVICIANNSIRKSNLRFTFTRRGRTVLQKTLQSGESHQFKLKNGSYHVVVDNPDIIRFKGLSDPYATHGDMTVSSQVYRFDYYSIPISEESRDKSTLSSKYSDRKAEDRALAAMYSYLEKNKISVWLNTNECIKDRIIIWYFDGYNTNKKYKDVFLTGDILKEQKKIFADKSSLVEHDFEVYRIPLRVVMFDSGTQTNDVFEYSVAELKRLKAKKQKK